MSPFGAAIMTIFAAIWWVLGVRAGGASSIVMMIIPCLATGALLFTAFQRRGQGNAGSPEEQRRRDRVVTIASAAEGIAILVAVNVLANIGLRSQTTPVIAIIVGLHFLPIARWLPARTYYLTAGLLIALGLAGLAIGSAPIRIIAVSTGAATILWTTAAIVLSDNG